MGALTKFKKVDPDDCISDEFRLKTMLEVGEMAHAPLKPASVDISPSWVEGGGQQQLGRDSGFGMFERSSAEEWLRIKGWCARTCCGCESEGERTGRFQS